MAVLQAEVQSDLIVAGNETAGQGCSDFCRVRVCARDIDEVVLRHVRHGEGEWLRYRRRAWWHTPEAPMQYAPRLEGISDGLVEDRQTSLINRGCPQCLRLGHVPR